MYASHDTQTATVSASGTAPAAARFTALEARVLRLAASGSERPSTSVEPALRRLGRRIGGVVMARRGHAELADPRLEALRSYGASVRLGKAYGLALFYAAGYTPAQAHEVKRVIASEIRAARHRAPKRDRVMYASGVSIGLASMLGFVAMTGTLLAGY